MKYSKGLKALLLQMSQKLIANKKGYCVKTSPKVGPAFPNSRIKKKEKAGAHETKKTTTTDIIKIVTFRAVRITSSFFSKDDKKSLNKA